MRKALIVSLITGLAVSFTGYAAWAATYAPALTPHAQAIGDIMLGEMAMSQNQIPAAHQYYLQATQLSQDPDVAKRTLYLALTVGQNDMALSAARQWAALAPHDAQAQLFNMTLYLKANQPKLALNYLQRALRINDKEVLNGIIGELQQTPLPIQRSLLQAILQLPLAQLTDLRLQLIMALIQFQTGASTQGILSISNVLSQKPDWAQAIALKADFLIQDNQVDAAVDFTNATAKAYPKIAMIQLIYAEVLIKAKKNTAAINKLQQLKKIPETRGIALLSLAQLAMQQQDVIQAQQYLTAATSDPIQAGNAYYLLGEIYQFEHKPQQAIAAYKQVTTGERYLTSQLKAAMILMSLNKNEEALDSLSEIKVDNMQEARQIILLQVELLLKLKHQAVALKVLNKALTISPKDTELLYARSMVANTLGDNAQTEADLKKILIIDPKQVNALNALGYLLIKSPNRYQEALTYTQQALTLAPDDPAVLDTMGWLQYHMGNYGSASHYLNEAYKRDDDALIAAHYGEVLWQMGKKPAAEKIWQTSLAKFPDSADLTSTIKRLTVGKN